MTSDGQTTVYDYYDDGRRESITYNDNFRQVYTYYDDGLLDTLTNQAKDDQGVFAESEYYKYCYDGAHNMTQKQERLGGPTEPTETTSYGYDCMNRLKNIYEPDINTAQRTIAYTYDSRGNRDTEIETITATNEVTYTKYEYTDNNRIQYVTKREDNQYGNIIQKKLYLHDSNGNLKNVYDITNGPSTITTNTYTLLNQLKTTVTTGINQQMENTYNAEGKRVAKTVDGTTARYFYEYDNVVFEYTNSGAISAFNVIGTNLISRETGTNKVYYFYNGHADVTALLDATTKSIRSQYKYDEFGNITSETYYDSTGEETIDENEIIKSQILYAGYQYDEESKYYNLQARYYDPQTARFLQQDTYMGTIADPLSLNLYAYCHNEPMMYVDPTGYTGEKSALTLVNEIIAAKKGWEESQLNINKYYKEEDSDIDVKAEIANKYKYASNAATAREMLKDTDAYKNDAYFREACNAYLKKAYGGTMSDVKQLQSMLSTLMYRPAPPPPPSKGTGNDDAYAKVSTDKNRLSPAEQVANAQYIYDYLSQKDIGWSKEAICGLLGNIQQESWFNPGVWQDLNNTTLGYGIVQWDDATKFLNWAGLDKNSANNMAKSDAKKLMNLELDFLLSSMKPGGGEWLPSLSAQYGSPYKMTYADFIISTKNAGDLALVFHGTYERSHDDATKKQNRIDYANNWYNLIGDTNAAIKWITSVQ